MSDTQLFEFQTEAQILAQTRDIPDSFLKLRLERARQLQTLHDEAVRLLAEQAALGTADNSPLNPEPPTAYVVRETVRESDVQAHVFGPKTIKELPDE